MTAGQLIALASGCLAGAVVLLAALWAYSRRARRSGRLSRAAGSETSGNADPSGNANGEDEVACRLRGQACPLHEGRESSHEGPSVEELQAQADRLRKLLDEARQRVAELRRLMLAPSASSADGLAVNGARREDVSKLSKTGMDPLEIAARLNVPVGEVELILNLRRCGDENAPNQE